MHSLSVPIGDNIATPDLSEDIFGLFVRDQEVDLKGAFQHKCHILLHSVIILSGS